ncbi:MULTISPECIES: DinB family protein [Paenibacillus]|uniref:DinB family protein n=1 Tax=Paenibacillus TaxID=44249 RepID=UPI0022B87CCA|nr:DinB family protein [Paenibacillus caseinilyticus]MCZ8523243.1 DinB family protein [Paenibacillus caseinilyticus]
MALTLPAPTEYNEFYAGYIAQAPKENLSGHLQEQLHQTAALVRGLSEEQALHRYAEDKWSVKELLGHMADTERIMSYRLLRIARGDTTPLPGFDQDLFNRGASFDDWSVGQLADELTLVRQATLSLIAGLRPDDWLREGSLSGFPITARALAHIIAGHELHHLRILQERYI